MPTREDTTQAVPVNDRTRRQVEEYRKRGGQNRAGSIVNTLRDLPAFQNLKPEVPSRKTKAAPKPAPAVVEGANLEITMSGSPMVWVVLPEATPSELLETLFEAGRSFLAHQERTSASKSAALPVLDTGFKTSRLVVKPMKGESEKVVSVLQSYFKVSRQKAREIVWYADRPNRAGREVDALQVKELNETLRKRKLRTVVHMASCAALK